jgi:hypothetical protein
MITKNDVHTFIVDTDNWRLGTPFQKAKFFHENCGRKGRTTMWEQMHHVLAGICCWTCKTSFTFPDWAFLLTFLEHRPIVHYQKGRILRFFHKDFLTKEPSIAYKEPCEIKVQKKNKDKSAYFDHVRIVHKCEPLPFVVFHAVDSYRVSNCGSCLQEFDFTNLDLLVAFFNASLYNASTEVTTASGKVLVNPMKSRKE